MELILLFVDVLLMQVPLSPSQLGGIIGVMMRGTSSLER